MRTVEDAVGDLEFDRGSPHDTSLPLPHKVLRLLCAAPLYEACRAWVKEEEERERGGGEREGRREREEEKKEREEEEKKERGEKKK